MSILIGVPDEIPAWHKALRDAKAAFEEDLQQGGQTLESMAVQGFVLSLYTKFKVNAIANILIAGGDVTEERMVYAEVAAIEEGRQKIVDMLTKPMIAHNLNEATRKY